VRDFPKSLKDRLNSEFNAREARFDHVDHSHKYSFDNRYTNHIRDCESGEDTPKMISKLRGSSINIESNNTSAGFLETIFTKIIVKCLVLSVVFLSLLNFAPAILSKRLSELNIHEYLYGLIFAIP